MDGGLATTLEALCLSWVWHNDAGDEYGPADGFFDARSQESAVYGLINGFIALTLDDLRQDGALEEARKWESFGNEIKLVIYDSNHDLIAKRAKGEIPEGYEGLLSEVDPEAV